MVGINVEDIRVNLRFFTATGKWRVTEVLPDGDPVFRAVKVWDRPGYPLARGKTSDFWRVEMEKIDVVDRWS